MSENELDRYLKDNLTIELITEKTEYGSREITVRLLLRGGVISSDCVTSSSKG